MSVEIKKPLLNEKDPIINQLNHPILEKVWIQIGAISPQHTYALSKDSKSPSVPPLSLSDRAWLVQSDYSRSLEVIQRQTDAFGREIGGGDFLGQRKLERAQQTIADMRGRIIYKRGDLQKQYLTQGIISIDGEYGKLSSRFTILVPRKFHESAEVVKQRPISILLPSIAGDIAVVEGLGKDIAEQEDEVVVIIGHPESWLGQTTSEFVHAIQESQDFRHHAAFFKEAIRGILESTLMQDFLGKTDQIKLRGYSAGAAVAAVMLNDPDVQVLVKEAYLYCPPCCVGQTPKQLNLGVALEVIRSFLHFSDLPKLFTIPSSNGTYESYTPVHREQMLAVYRQLLNIVRTAKPDMYKNMRVYSSGKIFVVAPTLDFITKTYKAKQTFLQNPQVEFVLIPGSHVTPLTHYKRVSDAIYSLKES